MFSQTSNVSSQDLDNFDDIPSASGSTSQSCQPSEALTDITNNSNLERVDSPVNFKSNIWLHFQRAQITRSPREFNANTV